jgi:short-subunit dehydrogenase
LAESLARAKYDLVLAARDERDLGAVAADVALRHGVTAIPLALDLVASDKELEDWLDRCRAHFPRVDAVLIPAGAVDDGDDGMADWSTSEDLMTTNFLAVTKIAGRFLADFERRNCGTLVLFSSIAATAPRRRNVVYSAAKSALESYARSMQHRFAETSVNVQLYALGYVDTSMTRGRRLLLPVVSSSRVADMVVRRLDDRHRKAYYPRFWRVVARGVARLPWALYRRLDF